MSANRDPAQGRLPLQPGNVDSNEEFPEFCLHACAQVQSQGVGVATTTGGSLTFNRQRLSSSASSVVTTTSTSSSRASYASTASTSSGSVFSLESSPSSPEFRVRSFSTCSPTPRNRRDKEQLHAARLRRSASNSLSFTPKKKKEKLFKATRFQRSFSSPADALAAVEPPHDQGLTRMAFAEQQRWITVQQKTFTKWYMTVMEYLPTRIKD